MGPAAIVAGIALTGVSIQQQRKAAKAQNRATEVQERIQNIKAARQRREQLRQARIARAQIVAASEVSGTSQSSSVAGGLSDVSTQFGGNVNFLNTVKSLSERQGDFLSKSATASSNAQTSGQLAGLSFRAANTDFSSIFSGDNK